MRRHILTAIWMVLLTSPGLFGGEITLRSGFLAEDSPWKTPWYEVDSGVDGPVVLITGGVHGNEPAGFRAAEQIRHWPIQRGRLLVIPQVNKLGLAANMRWLPKFRNDKSRRDPNRNFPKLDQPNEAQTPICQALWQFARKHEPAWVLDLHEGFDFHIANDRSVGASVIYRDSPETKSHAEAMVTVVNETIDDKSRRFVHLNRSGPVAGSFVRAAMERMDCHGFILETSFRDQPLSLRVRQHRMMVSTLLGRLGMIADDCTGVMTPRDAAPAHHVALYDGPGTGAAGVANLTKILDEDSRFVVHRVGPADLQTTPVEQFSLVIFPGGSGSRQAAALGPKAKENVRRFVRGGGGYLGICAGAYLCSAHYDWSLNLVDTKVFTGQRHIPGEGPKAMWRRGAGTVKIELTDAGKKIFGDQTGLQRVRYQNGPIVSPAGRKELPTYLPLAYFRTEVAAWEPQRGTMVDSPAIVAGTFGKGRVMAISPHPESTEGRRSMINSAVAWLCQDDDITKSTSSTRATATTKLP